MTEGEYTWDEGGTLAQLNSLAWQQRGEMIVGNCPACRCVGVCQRAGDWMERVKRRGWVWVWVCVRLLSCVESLPVSGRLSWVFFIWSVGAVSTAWGGYSLAWHGRVWSGLPAALWMREQQQVNQCIMQGTNKDFIPSSGTPLNVCTQTSWAWALFWFGCIWINPSVKLWNLWQSWLLCWFGLLCSLF